MPRYPEELLDEIAARNDIVDVISQHVSLKKKGSTYFGLCPFHNEKTASFSVTPAKQMFYCFGCGAGGSVYTFLQKYDNLSFTEAVEVLAERAGVPLPKVEMTAEQKRAQSRREKLFEIQKEAATYFYRLLRSDYGKLAYRYFQGRALTEETMQQFGLGYSDKRSDDLYRYLSQKGYADELLRDSGLVSMDERGVRDKFFNRAMFPIMDHQSRVVAFGGRVMGEGEPKYLNSPETPIFDKSRTLYGLHLARRTKRDAFLLCEGYMDVIALHQAGFDNAVASLGTAFTPGHAALIARYVKSVYLSFDSDDAGTRAKLRAIPILREAGLGCKVIRMEPYKDPDEFIKALGSEAYEERIRTAENAFMFSIGVLERDYNMSDPTEKTSFLNEVARRILDFPEEIERTNYIDAVAEKYALRREDLRSLVLRLAARGEKGRGSTTLERGDAPQGTDRRGKTRKQVARDASIESQKLLLTWISNETELYPLLSRYLTMEDFSPGTIQTVAGQMFAQLEAGELSPGRIIHLFEDEEEQQEVASIFHATIGEVSGVEEKEKALRELLLRVKRDAFHRNMERLPENDSEILQKTLEEKRMQKELERIHFYGESPG